MNNFYSVKDVVSVKDLVKEAIDLKNKTFLQIGTGKTIVLLFFNPSLRTRLSTQKAAQELGMNVIVMNAVEGWNLETKPGAIMNSDKAEHIKDAAKVISQYADIIGIRAFPKLENKEDDYKDVILKSFMEHAEVPVINLESSILHPCQSLADMLTISEFQKSSKNKIVLSWAPHPKPLPHAVANSFLEWINHTENEVVVTHPPGYELCDKFMGNNQIEYNQMKAFDEADFVYVKNWSSFNNYGKVLSTDSSWLVNQNLMGRTNDAYLMHCLPVRRNVVLSDDILDGPKSLVYKQANNRSHAAKIIIKKLLSNE